MIKTENNFASVIKGEKFRIIWGAGGLCVKKGSHG